MNARVLPEVRAWLRAMFVFFTLMGFALGSWLSRIPAMRDHLDASTFRMSVYGFCLATGSVIGLVLAGRLVSALGPRRAIRIAGLAQSIAMPAAATLLWFRFEIAGLAALMAFGFLFSIADVAMNVSGAGAERAEGKNRMPLFHAGFSMGGVLAMGTGALAEFLRIPVPVHLVAVFSLVAIGTVLCARVTPSDAFGVELGLDPSQPASPPADASLTGTSRTGTPSDGSADSARSRPLRTSRPRSSWRDPRVLLIGLIMMSMSLAEGTGADWIPLALVDGRAFENTEATLVLGAFFVSMMVIRLFGSPILDRFGRVVVLRGGALLCAAGVVSMILIPHPVAALLGAMAWGVGCAFGFPVGMSAAADYPETAIRDVAAACAIAYTAFLMGPMAVGFLGEAFGLLTAFWLLVAAVTLSALLAPAAREPEAVVKTG